jgi:hypothetical protein
MKVWWRSHPGRFGFRQADPSGTIARTSPSAVAALDSRWQAFVDEATRLSDRFDARQGKAP